MKIQATHCGKRKAIDTVEDDYVQQLEERNQELEERNQKLEQALAELKKSKDVDVEEDDWSDGEESDPDDSDPWTIMFLQLREYKVLHGDCKVPHRSKDYKKLGEWVNNQKKAYKNVKTGKKGKSINSGRIAKLESIAFDWGKAFPPPKSWDEMFAQLQNYQQKMGNCNIPFNATNPTPLAKWTAYQRAEYKRFKQGRDSLLTLDQIGQLKEIGFKWKGPKI